MDVVVAGRGLVIGDRRVGERRQASGVEEQAAADAEPVLAGRARDAVTGGIPQKASRAQSQTLLVFPPWQWRHHEAPIQNLRQRRCTSPHFQGDRSSSYDAISPGFLM